MRFLQNATNGCKLTSLESSLTFYKVLRERMRFTDEKPGSQPFSCNSQFHFNCFSYMDLPVLCQHIMFHSLVHGIRRTSIWKHSGLVLQTGVSISKFKSEGLKTDDHTMCELYQSCGQRRHPLEQNSSCLRCFEASCFKTSTIWKLRWHSIAP